MKPYHSSFRSPTNLIDSDEPKFDLNLSSKYDTSLLDSSYSSSNFFKRDNSDGEKIKQNSGQTGQLSSPLGDSDDAPPVSSLADEFSKTPSITSKLFLQDDDGNTVIRSPFKGRSIDIIEPIQSAQQNGTVKKTPAFKSLLPSDSILQTGKSSVKSPMIISHTPMLRVTPRTYKSPTQYDPFYDTGGRLMQNEKETSLDMDSPTWVTVFGFSPSKASYILKQFSHYGEILDHKIGNGNWMHILYRTKFQAQKALSKNGKVYNSVLMIGVVECIDREVLAIREQFLKKPTTRPKKRTFADIMAEPTEQKFEPLPLETPPTKRPKPAGLWSKVIDFIFKF